MKFDLSALEAIALTVVLDEFIEVGFSLLFGTVDGVLLVEETRG